MFSFEKEGGDIVEALRGYDLTTSGGEVSPIIEESAAVKAIETMLGNQALISQTAAILSHEDGGKISRMLKWLKKVQTESNAVALHGASVDGLRRTAPVKNRSETVSMEVKDRVLPFPTLEDITSAMRSDPSRFSRITKTDFVIDKNGVTHEFHIEDILKGDS